MLEKYIENLCISEDLFDQNNQKRSMDTTKVKTDEHNFKSLNTEGFPLLLSSLDEEQLYISLQELRRDIANPFVSINKVTELSEIIPKLVELLGKSSNFNITYELTWILTNIASGSTAQTMEIVNSGGVNELVRILTCAGPQIQEQAAWCLGNIAGDSTAARDSVLHSGCVIPLIQLAVCPGIPLSTVRIVAWVFANLCRGKRPVYGMVSHCLPLLGRLIQSNDTEVLISVTESFSYLSDGSYGQSQAILHLNIIKRLVELLLHYNRQIVTSSLRTLGSIIMGSNLHTKAVVDAGILSPLRRLIELKDMNLVTEVCWTVSNVAADSKELVTAVLDAGLLVPATHLACNGPPRVRREAVWILINSLFYGDRAILATLATPEVIFALCSFLKSNEPKMTVDVLVAINILLKFGDNFQPNPVIFMIRSCQGELTIEKLMNSEDNFVSSRARDIFLNFFPNYTSVE